MGTGENLNEKFQKPDVPYGTCLRSYDKVIRIRNKDPPTGGSLFYELSENSGFVQRSSKRKLRHVTIVSMSPKPLYIYTCDIYVLRDINNYA